MRSLTPISLQLSYHLLKLPLALLLALCVDNMPFPHQVPDSENLLFFCALKIHFKICLEKAKSP